jgi:hypothetical protein
LGACKPPTIKAAAIPSHCGFLDPSCRATAISCGFGMRKRTPWK